MNTLHLIATIAQGVPVAFIIYVGIKNFKHLLNEMGYGK